MQKYKALFFVNSFTYMYNLNADVDLVQLKTSAVNVEYLNSLSLNAIKLV